MSPSQTQKTAAELEWPRLLERIASFCQSDAGARALSGLMPESSYELGRARMERTREAVRLLAISAFPSAAFEDQAAALDGLGRGVSLDARELRALGAMLEQSARLRQYLERHADVAPLCGSWLSTSPALGELEKAIARCIGPDAAILDGASEALARARRRADAERSELRQRLTQLLGRFAEALSGQYLAERDGRFVLPVRADAPFRIDGLVLGSSASGSTLYVEPRETHDLGNRVQIAEAEVRAEEARVLDALNAALSLELQAVMRARLALIEADVLSAIARYGKSVDAIALLPEPVARLDLKQMRHPLLLGSVDVVPNDLSIEAGRGVIISGPNAGGKTVALECLGLAAWMARAGLPIPVAPGSSVGWFGAVLTDIGDHQSLMHSLSTFSAHVSQVAAALGAAESGALVLIDELGGGTDPDEGAALAVAVVESLVARGAAVCVTTHHERLKTLAAEHPQLTNAAVGFDRERLAPTFSIEYGVPGASSAFSVAERFGIDAEIIARAAAVLPEDVLARRALLSELDEQRGRLARSLAEAEAERQLCADLRRELSNDKRRRMQEERVKLSQETQAVLDEVQRARARLRDAELRLGQGASGAELAGALRATSELARFVAIGGQLREAARALDPAPAPAAPPLSWSDLAIGVRVSVHGMGASGSVVAKPRRDQVTVAIGAMKTTVGIDAVSLAAPLPRAPTPPQQGGAASRGRPRTPASRAQDEARSGPAEGAEPMRTRQNTLNLVGQRVEAALEQLDGFIDGLLRESEPAGFVVHGHGTGALRSAIREHLSQHPNVRRSGPAARDDGGDALTRFWIV